MLKKAVLEYKVLSDIVLSAEKTGGMPGQLVLQRLDGPRVRDTQPAEELVRLQYKPLLKGQSHEIYKNCVDMWHSSVPR